VDGPLIISRFVVRSAAKASKPDKRWRGLHRRCNTDECQ
jgi:hypothetical protein